ncbi:hypothetical protein Tco_1316059 [Tanacetum coccineum]
MPNVGEPSEVSNVGASSEVPNVGESSEVPNVADQTEMPNVREHSDGSEDSDDNEDRPNEVLVEDTQPVEDEVFEDVDLEDFESASDPYDIDSNRKKSLKKLARKHKPEMVSRLVVENKRQLYLTRNDKVGVGAQCRGVVPTFSTNDGSQFRPNRPTGSGRPKRQIP